METKYKEIPFFKIPKFMKNLNCTIDILIVSKRYGYGTYIFTGTGQERITKPWVDAEVYLVNKGKQLVISGWTFRGSQFLEIDRIQLYKNQTEFEEFIESLNQPYNTFTYHNNEIDASDALKPFNDQFNGTSLPKFYLTSKYDNRHSHLFTWNNLRVIASREMHSINKIYYIKKLQFN